jgi:hypothetical protein
MRGAKDEETAYCVRGSLRASDTGAERERQRSVGTQSPAEWAKNELSRQQSAGWPEHESQKWIALSALRRRKRSVTAQATAPIVRLR